MAQREFHERSVAGWHTHLAAMNRPGAVRRWLAIGSIDGVARRTASRRPGAEAVRIDGRRMTHGELGRWSDAVATLVRERGAEPGDRVLVGAPSSLEMVASYLGVLKAGCVALLANPALTGPELGHLVADAEPSLGLVSEPVGAALGDMAGRGSRVGTDGLPPGGEALLCVALGNPRRAASPPGVPRAAVLAYTSGSTGRPKGALLSHANLLATGRSVMSAWRWGPSDVTVHCLPLFHLHGLSSLHAVLLGGGRAVIQGRLDPDELAATVGADRATIFLGVPAVHRRLVEAAPPRSGFGSLRLLVSGSAPLPPTLAAELEELTGQVPLERYGTTESGLDVSNPYDGERRQGSVGLPLPGVEMIVADDSGAELPDGTDGEVLIRGPQVFGGYWGAAADGETFAAGGWWRTGDIGRVDVADGYLSITGRAKELIITGGLNVYPREVESAIERHAAILAVAVAGVPSRRWGEEVTAFVVFRPGMSAEVGELAALCRERLAPYKRPKRIVIVEELPVNALGKVKRDVLSASVSGSEGDGG